ncbi:hypothetical protein [Bradyrhizobium sp. USDA 4473]
MQSNRLTVLAADIKDKLAASSAAETSAIALAMAAGESLNEARSACDHGEWLPFLSAAGVPERKAQRYMKLARSGLNPTQVSDLGGIKATLHWLQCLPRFLDEPDTCLVVCKTSESRENHCVIASHCEREIKILHLDPRNDFANPSVVATRDNFWSVVLSLFDCQRNEMLFTLFPKDSQSEIRRALEKISEVA